MRFITFSFRLKNLKKSKTGHKDPCSWTRPGSPYLVTDEKTLRESSTILIPQAPSHYIHDYLRHIRPLLNPDEDVTAMWIGRNRRALTSGVYTNLLKQIIRVVIEGTNVTSHYQRGIGPKLLTAPRQGHEHWSFGAFPPYDHYFCFVFKPNWAHSLLRLP